MRLSDFRVLCIEPYGTLIDRDSGIHAALRPLIKKGRVTLDRDDLLARFAECEAAQRQAAPRQSYAKILANTHQRLAKALGLALFDVDDELFAQSVQHWPVYADAPAALQYLVRYFKLFILTNADRESAAAGKRQLPVRFEATFTGRDVDAYKPDRRGFKTLLSRLAALGIEREDVLLITAGPRSDLVVASKCGVASVWIDRQRRPNRQAGAPIPRSLHFASMVDIASAHQRELAA